MTDSELREIMKLDFRRRKFFLDNGDTYGGMVWDNFHKKVQTYGFVLGYSNEFRGNYEDPEMEVLYYLEDKGLIVHAYTQGGFIIEKAQLYGEICDVSQDYDISQHIGLESCWHLYHPKNNTIEFSIDVDQGLGFKSNTIIENYN